MSCPMECLGLTISRAQAPDSRRAHRLRHRPFRSGAAGHRPDGPSRRRLVGQRLPKGSERTGSSFHAKSQQPGPSKSGGFWTPRISSKRLTPLGGA